MESRRASLTFPELAIVATTRAILGAGIALLVGDRIPREEKKTVGWTLVAVGLLITIPIGLTLLGQRPRRAASPDANLLP